MTVDIFKDKEMLDHLNDEIPLVVSMISEVRDYECEVFLPEPVNNLLNFMLKLYSKVFRLNYLLQMSFKQNAFLLCHCIPAVVIIKLIKTVKVMT